MIVVIFFALGAYLFGSIPTAYILVRLFKGVDIRKLGTGTVGGSNAGQVLGKWAAVVVGLLDIAKGALPALLAQHAGLTLGEQMAIGLATIAGHNWSVFLGFQGGRGLATIVGVLLALAPLELLMFIIIAVLGIGIFRDVPLFMGLATLLLPVWSLSFEEPTAITAGCLGMVILTAAKRLLGNHFGNLPHKGKAQTLFNRLLFDRDCRERAPWVHGAPPQEGASKPG